MWKVKIGNRQNPALEIPVEKFELSAKHPTILCILKDYANGHLNFSNYAKLIVFATSTLEETKQDDFRRQPFIEFPRTILSWRNNGRS
jgi:dTDP-4-dehydrorhamnose 3,5-epimerase-like enzyme